MGRLKKILFCSYREWSNKICDEIEYIFSYDPIDFIRCDTQEKFLQIIKKEKFDVIFFLGWSDIISEKIVNSNLCICLHPSLLPLYRGGSPLQNQLINNEDVSGITLFKMDKSLDKGPIIYQGKFNLKEEKNKGLDNIYSNIIKLGIQGIKEITISIIKNENIKAVSQSGNSTYFKRRTPNMSEIQIEDFKNNTAEEILNKVVGLQDPYPNAFVLCKNGTKLYIKDVKI